MLMLILVALVSLFVFGKSLGYALYEIKNNKNKYGGISIICLATIASIIAPFIFSVK